MASQEMSASERTAAALNALKPVSRQVEAAAQELAKPISAIESALRSMHVAFEAWVTYRSNRSDADESFFTTWDIGYTRYGGRWCIALRVVRVDLTSEGEDPEERWAFNEAPIYLRHAAVAKLPDLVEALAKTGEKVATKLQKATADAAAIADAVAPRKGAK